MFKFYRDKLKTFNNNSFPNSIGGGAAWKVELKHCWNSNMANTQQRSGDFCRLNGTTLVIISLRPIGSTVWWQQDVPWIQRWPTSDKVKGDPCPYKNMSEWWCSWHYRNSFGLFLYFMYHFKHFSRGFSVGFSSPERTLSDFDRAEDNGTGDCIEAAESNCSIIRWAEAQFVPWCLPPLVYPGFEKNAACLSRLVWSCFSNTF